MMLKKRKTADELAAADLLAKIKAEKENARKARIVTEKRRKLYEEYRAYVSSHPDYVDRGITRWRNEQWQIEHPAVTRSTAIRQEFIFLAPEKNRPISRATSDREIAEGVLRYRRNKEWHEDADLITIGFWLTLAEEVDVLKMDADLLTAWLGNALGKKERSRYEVMEWKGVEL